MTWRSHILLESDGIKPLPFSTHVYWVYPDNGFLCSSTLAFGKKTLLDAVQNDCLEFPDHCASPALVPFHFWLHLNKGHLKVGVCSFQSKAVLPYFLTSPDYESKEEADITLIDMDIPQNALHETPLCLTRVAFANVARSLSLVRGDDQTPAQSLNLEQICVSDGLCIFHMWIADTVFVCLRTHFSQDQTSLSIRTNSQIKRK